MSPERTAPAWTRGRPDAAATSSLASGSFVVLLPLGPFRPARIEAPSYPETWRCDAMIVGVDGVGHGIAAGDRPRDWPIVLAGILSKVLGPIGSLGAVLRVRCPRAFGRVHVTNHLNGRMHLSLILSRAFQQKRAPAGPVAG